MGHHRAAAAARAGELHLPATALQAALAHGFELVMLYGGLGVWILAAFSLVTFGPPRPDAAVNPTCPQGAR